MGTTHFSNISVSGNTTITEIPGPATGETVVIGDDHFVLYDTYAVAGKILVINTALDIATGVPIKANGTQAATIANASVAHNTVNAAGADTALNAIGTKMNSILTALKNVGIIASS